MRRCLLFKLKTKQISSLFIFVDTQGQIAGFFQMQEFNSFLIFCSTMLNQTPSLVFGVYVRVEKYVLSA